jgi:transglutaminase-like putative cysteine protease
MTTHAFSPQARLGRFITRLSDALRHTFSLSDVIMLLVAAGLTLTPLLALNAAGWMVDLRVAFPVIVLSTLFSFLLARSQYGEILCLLISVVYGGVFTLVITALYEPRPLGAALLDTFVRLGEWVYDALSGGINQDPLVFTLIMSSLFWFLGFNAVWHIFRIDRVWRGVLPLAIVLLTNHIYYVGARSLDVFLIVFFFLVLLLLVRSTLEAREWEWYIHQVRAPRRLRWQFLALGALFALLVGTFAWSIPQRDIETRLQRFQEAMQGDALVQLAELWNRLFASADVTGPATSEYYGSDNMTLGGAVRLGDQPVLLVSAPPDRRYYWKSRSFDVYDNGRWSSLPDTRLTDTQPPLLIEHETYLPGARTAVNQIFTLAMSGTQILYTAPQPLSIDLPTRTDLRFTPDDNLVDTNMHVSVIRPLRVLTRGESYRATSLVSTAQPDQLRAAGDRYPAWVRELYNSYLPSVSARTIQLANDIVRAANATTPYDRAVAIETWLRQNMRYNETIPQPPIGQDAVDWFLFTHREGYCNYYASAMVVMLRSLGIPARMAAGFAQGQYDPVRGVFVVRERDAHTWVEVYFPGYGWVEFEPTAAQPPLTPQSDANRQGEVVITPTSIPTSTPTPTPTSTPTLPPPPGATPDPFSSLTATPEPTPTPTPFVQPTVPPPLPPTPPNSNLDNPFGALLPAIISLAALLLLILLIVLLLAILYWWWEWRGMRGLSPISRAYARLMRYAALVGFKPEPTSTPEERRVRIVRALPAAEAPITAITRLYTRERYGGRRVSRAQTQRTADDAWESARGTILSRFLRRLLFFWRRD